MFDIKWIRDNPEKFDEGIGKRGLDPQAASLIALDEERRHHLADLQNAQQRRNTISRTIGSAMAAGETERAQKLKAEIADIKSFVQSGADRERSLDRELLNALSAIPNIPMEDVPVGEDETANVVHATWGEKPSFNHDAKEHFELGEALGMMDFSGASAISGSRFVVLRGALARLERALGQFMLDLHTAEHGYTEIAPPLLVKDEALYGTGQLPKFAEDLFRVGEDRWLIPTAEVPLTNLVRGAILAQGDLPIRYTALTPSFRSEAGSAGRDTRGMLRQHQFMKVEMVSVTDAENGEAELERMTGCAEEVLKRLGLHYRVMTLSTGDIGFAARKTYDLEVWLPGQQAYREISSCSLCGDFQARRMNARYRRDGEKTNHFAHTLNGSGVAVGRALIAVMENYQTADGAITVPEVLRPYMAGQSEIMVGA